MTGLEVLFATVLSSVVAQFGAKTLAETVVGGVVGNRVDALFVKAFEGIQVALGKSGHPLQLQQAMGQALMNSYYQALISLIEECKIDILSDAPKRYRGVNQLSESQRETIQVLDDLKKQYEQDSNIAFEKSALSNFGQNQLPPESPGDSPQYQSLRDSLIIWAMKDIGYLPLVEKMGSESSGLWPRMMAGFAKEIHQNELLKDFVYLNLFIDIKQTSDVQLLSLDEINAKLDALIALSQPKEFTTQIARTTPSHPSVPNPFMPLTGVVKDPTQMFIPQETVGYLFELLNASPGIAIIGQEGMGKSTLLKILQNQAKQKLQSHQSTVFIDCKIIRDEAEFFGEFCRQARIKMSQNASELESRVGSKTFLLLLDEVDKMAWSGFTCEIRAQLRGFAESGWLKIALTARQSLDQLFPDSQGISPFEGVCLEHGIEPWSNNELDQFLRSRLEPTSIKFSESDIQTLMTQSQGNPRKLMQASFSLYRKYLTGA